jgi:hypothetical protein
LVNQYTVCAPDIDGDGTLEEQDVCVNIDGFNYCLANGFGFERYDLVNDAVLTNWTYPAPYVEVGGAPTQSTPGVVPLPRNNSERWSPTTLAWPDNNQIFTTNCTPGPDKRQYWLGCHWCDDPRVECWNLRMCRPSTTAVPNVCAIGESAQQTVLFYFENDRRE